MVLYERLTRRGGWRLESESGRVIAVGDSDFATANAANAEATQIIFGEYADVQIHRERREE